MRWACGLRARWVCAAGQAFIAAHFDCELAYLLQ